MGAIVPFRKSSGGGPRVRASGRVECVLHPADLLQQSETLRQTRQHIAEAWKMRAESRRIQHDYIERQKLIEKLMDGLGI
jgi:hypothetical protein